MKTLLVFDLDGTLLNTIEDLGNACNYALKKNGFAEHPLQTYRYMVGNGVRKLMQRAQPDVDEKMIDLLLSDFKEWYDEHNTEFTHPYPGIQELLFTLTERGIKLAVASNKYQRATEKIINYFFGDIPFVAVLGQVDDRPRKPDPSILFELLNRFPTPKREVMFVGDSAVDMETARRACVESVGVTWGYRPVSELRSAFATHIVSKPEEIFDFLHDPF